MMACYLVFFHSHHHHIFYFSNRFNTTTAKKRVDLKVMIENHLAWSKKFFVFICLYHHWLVYYMIHTHRDHPFYDDDSSMTKSEEFPIFKVEQQPSNNNNNISFSLYTWISIRFISIFVFQIRFTLYCLQGFYFSQYIRV